MTSELNIPTILNIAKICQYINVVRASMSNLFKGGDISEDRSELIYMERKAVQNRYNLNPNDPALPGAANYLFSILRYQSDAQQILTNQSIAGPVLTGPNNQSVNVNATATFSVSASGIGPFTYQWFDSFGNPISGATSSSYNFINAQLSDTGKTFFAKVTDANGKQTTSGVATLTVTANLFGRWYAGDVDYSIDLSGGTDDVPWTGTFSITDGQPLIVPFPAGQVKYVGVQYPASQSVKTHYANPASGIDQGTVPGLAFDDNTFGGNNYIFSRTGNPLGINNSSGQVTFS